jgi:hypothetical protein
MVDFGILLDRSSNELDFNEIEVKRFYHAGVWWKSDSNSRFLGKTTNGYLTERFFM